MATSIDDNATDEKSDKSIWRLLNIHCTRRLFQKSALLISPMNCSAATQLPQGLRSASVGAKRVPLAHSTYKHSKSADLLHKSLLSTLRFGPRWAKVPWTFSASQPPLNPSRPCQVLHSHDASLREVWTKDKPSPHGTIPSD